MRQNAAQCRETVHTPKTMYRGVRAVLVKHEIKNQDVVSDKVRDGYYLPCWGAVYDIQIEEIK
jgi:hypothetical protein